MTVSRAAGMGIRPAQLVKKARAKLARIRSLLEELGYAWADADSGYARDIEDLYETIDHLQGEALDEAIARLREPME